MAEAPFTNLGEGGAGADAILINCTLSANQVRGAVGGAVFGVFGSMAFTNCTLSGNTSFPLPPNGNSTDPGGAIYNAFPSR